MRQFKPKLKVAKISFLSPFHKDTECPFGRSVSFFLAENKGFTPRTVTDEHSAKHQGRLSALAPQRSKVQIYTAILFKALAVFAILWYNDFGKAAVS